MNYIRNPFSIAVVSAIRTGRTRPDRQSLKEADRRLWRLGPIADYDRLPDDRIRLFEAITTGVPSD